MNALERRLYGKYGWFQLGYNLLFVAFWYLANDGLAFWDDFTYLNFANSVNYNFFEITNNHFTSRVGMIYPVAWIIRWSGIDAFTITLYPFLCGLVLLNLLMWYGKRTQVWVGLIGGLFLVCDYHVLHFTTHLFPEMPMALCLFIALLCYDVVNRKEGDHRFLALLTALSLFVAFLIKTTIILAIPLFLFLFFNDRIRRGRNGSYWLITVACLTFFMVLNLFHYYEIKGDAFYRFNNISTNHEPTVKTFFDKPWQETLKRLTYLPFLGFLKGGFFISFLLALPAIISLKKKDWRLEDPTKLWPVATFLLLASWWFMSTNWEYYSPMPTDTRHITFLIPLLILAGLHWWTDLSLFKQVQARKWPFFLLLFLFLVPLYKINKANDRNFKDLEMLFSEIVLVEDQEEKKAKVFTDGLLSYGYPYFYDFKKSNFKYLWISEAELKTVSVGDKLLINRPFLNERYADFINYERLKAIIQERGWVMDCEGDADLLYCSIRH